MANKHLRAYRICMTHLEADSPNLGSQALSCCQEVVCSDGLLWRRFQGSHLQQRLVHCVWAAVVMQCQTEGSACLF